MFLLAKLLDLLTQPLVWVALLLCLGLVLLKIRPRLGRGLLWGGFSVFLIQGWMPLPNALVRALESQYAPPPKVDLSRYEGVIVLGGALESTELWEGRDQPALNSAAERMTAGVALVRQAPQLKLVFTGGNGEVLATALTEAERARRFYAEQGLNTQRILFESASRTTHENATLTAKLEGVDIQRPWLLLTSAWHMPRSMATFEKYGWNVTPWPVDYRTGSSTPWYAYSLSNGAQQWQLALHELLGLWAYRWTGRA